MSQVLNNEVDILNVANIDNDIRDSYTRAMIAGEEKETYCTRQGGYDINEFFIWTDRQIYKTKTPVDQGDTFVLNTNIELAGTLSDQMYQLFSQSPEVIREVLSNIENGSTASRNFRKGEYILWTDGFLYEVSANTNLGTAWTVGTNITKKNNITDELTSLNEALTKEVATRVANGAHNLLPVLFPNIVSDGVNFTVHTDGSISASGTTDGTHYIESNRSFTLKKGTYIFSTGNGSNYPQYRLYNASNMSLLVQEDNITFTLIEDTSIKARIYIVAGTVSGTLYPMIRLASDPNTTYQPYAMTNRELTDAVTIAKVPFTNGPNLTRIKGNVIRIGNFIVGNLTVEGSFNNADPVITIAEGHRPSNSQGASGMTLHPNDGWTSGEWTVYANGQVRQSITSNAVTKGTVSFAYYIGEQ